MILLTGGSGQLGYELQKYLKMYGITDVRAPSHQELDVRYPMEKRNYSMVIHAAAYTDVKGAEKLQSVCWDTNVNGTRNLVEVYQDIPFVFISTEYAKNPMNHYAKSKRAAEDIVATHPQHLIVRTSFKPRPFPFAKAFVDQFTGGDYVDNIAWRIVQLIEKWDRKSKMVYVHTGRKSIYDLAVQTRPDVGMMSIKDVKDVILPEDTYDSSLAAND